MKKTYAILFSIFLLSACGYIQPDETSKNSIIKSGSKYTQAEKDEFCEVSWKTGVRSRLNYSVDADYSCGGYSQIINKKVEDSSKSIFVQVYAPNGYGTKGVITFYCIKNGNEEIGCMTFKGKYIEDLLKIDAMDLLNNSDEVRNLNNSLSDYGN